jgi:hypothetical protein
MNIGAQMFDWIASIFIWLFKYTIKLAYNLIKNLIVRLINRKKNQ